MGSLASAEGDRPDPLPVRSKGFIKRSSMFSRPLGPFGLRRDFNPDYSLLGAVTAWADGLFRHDDHKSFAAIFALGVLRALHASLHSPAPTHSPD